jgi:hypothetical protein
MDGPMLGVDPTLRGGATWCEEHKRWECSKTAKSTRARCHFSAIRGLDRCRMHAGEKADIAKAKGEAITAWSAMGGQPTVSAAEAVLRMLEMSWLRVHLYARLLERQVDEAQTAVTAFDADDGEGEGLAVRRADLGAGLIGVTRSASPGVGVYVTGEAVRGLAQLEAAERDRCVRYAKTAHDMGIADKTVALLEQHAGELAGLINRILDGLDLNAAQRQLVAVVVPRELTRGIEGRALP